jgi:hypothetical protein
MENMHPDDFIAFVNQIIERDRVFLLKEEMLKSHSGVTRILDALGRWMIAHGEKLHQRHSWRGSFRKPVFLQDDTKILRA